MTTTTATDARATLPELLDRVAAGDEITITRHGRPVAVLVRPEALRVRRAGPALTDAAEIRALLDERRTASEALERQPGITAERAEALVADVRAGRDRARR